MDEHIYLTTDDYTDEPKELKPREETGHALAFIDNALFDQLLDLPKGVRVVAVYRDLMRNCLALHLEGNELPRCEEGAYPERAAVKIIHRRTAEGYAFERFEFTLPER